MLFFDHTQPKIVEITSKLKVISTIFGWVWSKKSMAILNLHQQAKNQFIPSIHSEIQPIFECRDQTVQTHF